MGSEAWVALSVMGYMIVPAIVGFVVLFFVIRNAVCAGMERYAARSRGDAEASAANAAPNPPEA